MPLLLEKGQYGQQLARIKGNVAGPRRKIDA
jgi:hypothetical protein